MKFNLDLKDEIHSELKILAVNKKKSMNKLIEIAIDEMLKKEKGIE